LEPNALDFGLLLETLRQVSQTGPEVKRLHDGVELPDTKSRELDHVLRGVNQTLQTFLHDLHVFRGYRVALDLDL
jgi:hypothetical protein